MGCGKAVDAFGESRCGNWGLDLWETGGRISELGNLQLKHVTKQVHGYLLDLYGKTGHRNPLVISSAPHLTQWLALHPFRCRR